MWSRRAKEVFDMLEPIAEGMGLKIIEIDLPGGQNGILRIYLDSLYKGKKVTLDQCSEFSPVVSNFIDTTDLFPFRYYLEVSSPGLDRPIRRWDEVADYVGQKVKINLLERIDNRRKVTGIIKKVDEDDGWFIVEDSQGELKITRQMVRKMNIIWEGEN